MSVTDGMNLEVRLSGGSADLCVAVRLRSFGGRWIGVAEITGERWIGIGATARHALTASLASLEDRDRALLLADPVLLGTSRALTGDSSPR